MTPKCFVKCLQMCFYGQHRTLFSITFCYVVIVKALCFLFLFFCFVRLVYIAN